MTRNMTSGWTAGIFPSALWSGTVPRRRSVPLPPPRPVSPPILRVRMRIRRTRGMVPMGAAVLLAAVLAAPTVAAAPSKPSSTAAAEKAVKDAKKRQDAVEKALEEVISRRQVAEARRREAGERLKRATSQLRKLQDIVSARARTTYMTVSPTSVARVVGQDDVDDLLDKMETIYQLAERSNQTLADLRALEGVAEESRSTLARVEKELRDIEKELQDRLKEADEAVDERVRAFDELRAKDALRAIKVA